MDGGGGRAEGLRWLEIAGRLLAARDLAASKRFAERALEADPLLDGVDQILAVADVLLASQRRISNNQVDWYAVLQIAPPSASSSASAADPAEVKRQYRRLALLLDPGRNHHSGADAAFRLVTDAFAILSDPAKKSLFDAELRLGASSAAPASKSPPSSSLCPAGGAGAFWTACPSCCNLHQYARAYHNRSLLCPSCRRPFQATEMPVSPPIVPGTDMYHCAWGFFPIGFPNAADLKKDWKPFHPMHPWPGNHPQPRSQPGAAKQDTMVRPSNGFNVGQGSGNKPRNKKTTARKRVVGGPKKKLTGGESEPAVLGPEAWMGSGTRPSEGEEEVRGISINEEIKGPEGIALLSDEVGMMGFHIDVDTTDELLGNLHNLPFLREEGFPGRMP